MAAGTRRRRKQTKRRNGLLKIWREKKAKLGRRRVVTAAAATHRKDWRLVVGGSSKKWRRHRIKKRNSSGRRVPSNAACTLLLRFDLAAATDPGPVDGLVRLISAPSSRASRARQANETLSSLVTWRGETTRFQAGGPVAAIPSSQSARLSVGRSETSEARPRSRGRRSDLLVTPSGALLSSDAISPGGGSTIGACVDGMQRAWWWRWGELGRRGQSRMTCRRLTRAWELLHGVAYLLSTKGGIFKLSRRRGSSKSLDERNARGRWDKL